MEGESRHGEDGPGEAQAAAPGMIPAESRRARLTRHGHRARLYVQAFFLVSLLVCLVALVLANTRKVELSWVFGSTHASLVWIILVAAILGWLLGLVIAEMFRRRTRRVLARDR